MMLTKKNLGRAFLILLFIVGVNTVQTYVLHITKHFGDIDFYKVPTHIFGIIACVISLFSTILAWKLTQKSIWEKASKFVTAFFLSVIIFALLESVFYILQRFFIYGLTTDFDLLVGNFVFTTVFFHLYISGLTLAFFYFQESAVSAIQLKSIENEKEMLQYKILQKNLEPHFLFNNLSILSGLVKKNPVEVEGFIDNFSDVYRYFLQHTDRELVTLEEEVKFLEKYISLMQKRFGNAYLFNIDLTDYSGLILPCTLQLCVENALKHNRGSDENPLIIALKRVENYIEVTNDMRPVDFTESSGLGNQFLQKSYEINFGQKVEYLRTETHYTVKIPLIL